MLAEVEVVGGELIIIGEILSGQRMKEMLCLQNLRIIPMVGKGFSSTHMLERRFPLYV